MTFKKILCATDFSTGAERALEAAIKVAVLHGAELVIAHAWQLPVYVGDYVPAPEMVQASVDDDNALIDKAVKRATACGVARVSGCHLRGVPWQAIVDVANDDHAIDLVVVGTHGRTGLRRVLLGSVATKIVRLAPVSVLAVHPDDRVGPVRHVLWPTDFSESAARAGELAAELVDVADGELERIHVVELPKDSAGATVVQDLERRAADLLERTLAGFTAPVRVSRHVVTGHASENLLARLESGHFDLVAVGSHGRTGLERLRLGSIAELLVRHARCPVLVARVRTA